ncbi:MAG TPA: SAM-dependent methyltransferase [Myxococcota bacterium]
MNRFELVAIAHVQGARADVEDDFWGGAESRLVLTDVVEESALDGIETFSHVEVLFVFDRVEDAKIIRGARHPRNNEAWPSTGILAQRAKNRPNRLGSTICRVVRREGGALVVRELDAVEGTPVVDIKPVLREFLPREDVRQPAWATELMRAYWNAPR